MSRDNISKEIEAKFGNQLRTRVNGILIQDDKILMIKHLMSQNKILWSVPGGGMQFGQSAHQNLQREFKEETNLNVEIGDFLFVNEYIHSPLQAIELFFEVKSSSGQASLGWDPEMKDTMQIISKLEWMDIERIRLIPQESLHQIFWGIKSLEDLVLLRGYFNFGNISLK